MTNPVTLERIDDIALIQVDNPPVNALGYAVRHGLVDAIDQISADGKYKMVVIACKGRTFFAGADISEFGKPMKDPSLPDVVNQIEALDVPVIAAIHGTALGGGLEIALGCHYRIAVASARLGLPEVLLGIIPGAGGTQRLPRLVGAQKAIAMITTGKPVSAKQALADGLIDELADSDDIAAAGMVFAEKVIANNMPVRRTRDQNDKINADAKNRAVFDEARKSLEKKARGLFSPFKAVDAVEVAVTKPIKEGLKVERDLFMQCMESPQRAGLVHAFFGERAVGKVPEMKTAKARDIQKVGIIGGGTMGAGISVAMMQSGIKVAMVERDAESADRGRANVDAILQGGVERGKLTSEQKLALLNGFYTVGATYDGVADADLVIEAAFEDMDLKKGIFETLDTVCKPGAILATNTSYLDINEIAAVTKRPSDVLGLHFFSPANLMRLLEIVVADKTAPDAVVSGFALAKKMKKVGVRAGVCDGFIGNRILSAYLKCADYMVLDGVSPYDIDKAMVEFGYPMGPFTVSDLAGLDIGWATRKRRAATRDPQMRYANFGDRICEQGWFGRKTGKGYYVYEKGRPGLHPNPEVPDIIATERMENGYKDAGITKDEIIRRYMAAMVNEAANLIDEGIAQRPVDVDMVLLFGYGFPRYRGGPMKYADDYGLAKMVADIQEFAKQGDERYWRPSRLLVELAENGKTFASLNQ